MNTRFPLASSSWDEAELTAMQDVIDSGFFTMGARVAAFEEQFSKFFGSRHAVMVNSGSSANLMMIAALFYSSCDKHKLKRGDEVIVPAVGWSTTYFPLQQYGLKLKFVDIDIHSLNYDLNALRAAIDDNTRAIIAVNLLGNPNDFTQIKCMMNDREILLIADNCESMGASFRGQKAGTFGIMGSFSCFFSHHISTMEGGVVLTDDEELYHIMLSLRSHGWTRGLPQFNKVTGEKSADAFEESWHFVLPGYNLRPTELSGALGTTQLKKLPDLINGRRANGRHLKATLAEHPDLMVQSEIGESSWFGFTLVIKPESKLQRPQLINKLGALGFEIRPIVSGNFTKNPVMRHFDYSISGSVKNAEYIDKNGVMIGNQHQPTPDAINALESL